MALSILKMRRQNIDEESDAAHGDAAHGDVVAPRGFLRGVLGGRVSSTVAASVQTPSYAALAFAVGASLWALCHVADDSGFTLEIWTAMLAGLVYSCVSRHVALSLNDTSAFEASENRVASESLAASTSQIASTSKTAAAKSPKRRRSGLRPVGWIVAFCLVVMPPVMAFSGTGFLVPLDLLSDNNLSVIVFIGWMMVASLFVVGAPYCASSGLRPVPFSAALVPALSLFGLLNLYSVDTVISICFLLFIAAALYLAAYETMLRGAQMSASQTSASQTSSAAQRDGVADDGLWNSDAVNRVWTTAGEYLLACVAWFAIFAGGAALFYYPLLAVLPTALPVSFASRGGSGAGGLLQTDDWRSPTRTMELRGGPYPLSNTPMMEITSTSEARDTLWRGRVYEKYSHLENQGTRWEFERPARPVAHIPVFRDAFSPLVVSEAAPAGAPRRLNVDEVIRPLGLRSRTIYASGRPIGIKGGVDDLQWLPDGTVRFNSTRRDPNFYVVRSQLSTPSPRDLAGAPALDSAQIAKWKSGVNRRLASLLEPGQGETAIQLRTIAATILSSRGLTKNATPARKSQAVSDYLHETCEYSLNPPMVPLGEDAVLNFLTVSKLGACDMFASSMTLLMRAMNVPARIASGYRFPSVDTDIKGRTVMVRDRDAHAWVEYYVPRFGWVKHDPTDGTRLAPPALTTQIGQMLHLNQLFDKMGLLLMPALGLLLLGIGAAWSVRDARRVAPDGATREDDAARQHLTRAYHEAARLISRRLPLHAPSAASRTDSGSRADSGQSNKGIRAARAFERTSRTPLEYEETVSRSQLSVDVKREFSALTYLFTAAHYNSLPASTVETAALNASLRRLKQGLKETK